VDVAAGLHWLHSHRIVHFDVKSQNILLARDGTAKISDVGLARILHRCCLRVKLQVRIVNISVFGSWGRAGDKAGYNCCVAVYVISRSLIIARVMDVCGCVSSGLDQHSCFPRTGRQSLGMAS
jgi:serine/threonine protein kinase